jgi:hypothetical protein
MAKIVDNVNTEHYPCTAKKSRLLYLFSSAYQYGLVHLLISSKKIRKVLPIAL